jgi:hypothetical protein
LQILEENTGITFQDIGTANDFLNRTPIAQEAMLSKDQWDGIKLQSFWTTKETMKRESTEWEEIFASYSSGKVLIFRKYKELKLQTTK